MRISERWKILCGRIRRPPTARFLLGYEHQILGQADTAHAQMAISAVLEPVDVVPTSMLARDGVEIVGGRQMVTKNMQDREGIGVSGFAPRGRVHPTDQNGRRAGQNGGEVMNLRIIITLTSLGLVVAVVWPRATLQAQDGDSCARPAAPACQSPPAQCTVWVPQIVFENRTILVARYRHETHERMVLVDRDVPVIKNIEEEYTVMALQTRTRTVEDTINHPVYRDISLRKTDMTPEVEARQATRHGVPAGVVPGGEDGLRYGEPMRFECLAAANGSGGGAAGRSGSRGALPDLPSAGLQRLHAGDGAKENNHDVHETHQRAGDHSVPGDPPATRARSCRMFRTTSSSRKSKLMKSNIPSRCRRKGCARTR